MYEKRIRIAVRPLDRTKGRRGIERREVKVTAVSRRYTIEGRGRTRKDEDWDATMALEADHRIIEAWLTYRSNS
jgi:hypothetical protein